MILFKRFIDVSVRWVGRRSLLVLACVFHLLICLYLLISIWPDQTRLYNPDSLGYDRLAKNLAFQQAFSLATEPPYKPSVFRTPLYPAFLSSLYLFFGYRPFAAIFAQVGLNIAALYLVFKVGSSLFQDEKVGTLAAGILALNGGFALHAFYLMTESLFTVLLASMTYILGTALFDPKRGYYREAAIGFLLGILTLCRPSALYLSVFLASIFFFCLEEHLYAKLKRIGVVLFCLLLTLSPWMMRNWYHFGSLRLDTRQGENLLYMSVGSMRARAEKTSLWEAIDQIVREERDVESHLNPLEMDRWRHQKAIKEILADPLGFSENSLYGIAIIYMPFPIRALHNFVGARGLEKSLSVEVSGLLRKGNVGGALRCICAALSSAPIGLLVGGVFFFVADILKFFFCATAIAILCSRMWPGLLYQKIVLLLVIVAYFTLIPGPLGPLGSFRFRVPVEPYLSLLAAWGVTRLFSCELCSGKRILVWSAVGFSVFCLVLASIVLSLAIPIETPV